MPESVALAKRPSWKPFGPTPASWLSGSRANFSQWEARVFLFVCGLYYFSESFVAFGWPALDGYPAIERWLDPSFLPSDFYTNTTQGYGVDTWQAVLFGSIQQHTGIHYALQIAILTALRHLLWPLVLCRFFTALLRDRSLGLLAVLLGVLADFALPKTLGWSWVWGDGSPALFATFFVVLAWTELLNRRAWAGFLLLALATVFQPLIGVHGGAFIALIFLFDYSKVEKAHAIRLPANTLAGLVFAAVFLLQYFGLSPLAGQRLPIREYVHILAWERHPGDFLPDHFSLETWIAFGLASAAMAIMAARDWFRLPRPALIVSGLALYALFCLAGYLFVEVWPVRLVVDLIPFRTVTIGAPLMLAIIACFVGTQLRARRWFSAIGLVAAFALAGPYGSRAGVSPIAVAALLLAGTIAEIRGSGRSANAESAEAGIGVVLRLAIPCLLVMAAPLVMARQSLMTLPTVANQHPVYAWARVATLPGARFLVEQVSSDQRYGLAISPQLMRLVGRRAVVASRDFPFRDSDARAWLKTWAIGLDHGRRDRVESASLADLRTICRSFPYDYVIRQRPLSGSSIQEVVRFGATKGIGDLHVYRTCG